MTQTIVVSPELKQHQIVRRYLDLPKFLDLLRSQHLYLRRADGFTDRFEGALTPAVRTVLDEAHQNGQISYSANEFYQRARRGNFVSCWNLGARDNMALWQLYGGAATSVVVTSTIDNLLAAAFEWGESVWIHKVRYIDHFRNPNMVVGVGTGVDLLQFKHDAYGYEKEVRIVVSRHRTWKANPAGISLPLGDLNKLIRSVVVAPEAPPWFFDLVEDVTRKYGVSRPVRRSKLTKLP
jgi:hypothetical protein